LQLQLPDSGDGGGIPLVCIYSPKIKYEREAAVAFNIKDCSIGTSLINPESILKLAEKECLALDVGFLSHIRLTDNQENGAAGVGLSSSFFFQDLARIVLRKTRVCYKRFGIPNPDPDTRDAILAAMTTG
jgi:hypothetical protein